MKVFYKLIKKRWLFFFLIVALGGFVSITLTSRDAVLEHDASSYLRLAKETTPFQLLGKLDFIDIGYPFVLSILIRFFGDNSLLPFQIINYLFWFLSTILVYESLKVLIEERKAFLGGLMMAFSPVFLSFSSKLYSEPFASFGTSLIIYSLLRTKKDYGIKMMLLLSLGMIILFFTKAVFSLLALVILLIVYKRKYMNKFLFLVGVVIAIFLRVFVSYQGGRSEYNLAIQIAKTEQSYSTIFSCSLYQLSYPIGKMLVGDSEGLCRQDITEKDIPGYENNPYVVAENLRREGFTIRKWLSIVLAKPVKYIAVVFSSMVNLILVEGFYRNFTTYTNSVFFLALLVLVKIFFSFYLWGGTTKVFLAFWKIKKLAALISIFPLIYFFVVVGNFPVEQRYFYPLLPFVYYYAAIDKKGVKKLVKLFQQRI